MNRLIPMVTASFVAISAFPSAAENCDADVELEKATQADDGWVTSEFVVLVTNCNRSQGTFDYTIYWTDNGGESGKPIRRVGNWGVQDTSKIIYVTERDLLVDGQTLKVVEPGESLTCVCHD